MIIANWKSNGGLMMIQDWTSDFINSCTPKDFYVGIAPPVIYISDFSLLEWDLDRLEEKLNNKIWDIKNNIGMIFFSISIVFVLVGFLS